MTTDLTLANVSEFLARFQHFYDAVVRIIQIDLRPQSFSQEEGEPRRVTIILSAIDRERGDDQGWTNVELFAEAVSEFALIRANSTWSVLTEGLSVGFFSGLTYMAFDAEAEIPDDYRQSQFYVVGGRCSWSVAPYSE